jgi:hypothetical protein
MGRKSLTAFFLGFFVVVMNFPTLMGFWIKHKLEECMRMKISGSWTPVFFQPSFGLRDVHFTWEDKVEVISGNLKVDYDLISLSRKELRLKLSSNDLLAELLGEWAEREGVQKLKVQRFYADLTFGQDGLKEIFSLEVKSPSLELRFQGSQAVNQNPPLSQKEMT